MNEDWRPRIFNYLNYRDYLSDFYDAEKVHNPKFSYRYFSRRAGYSSPNFLQLVIKGKRGLSSESVERFAKALDLGAKEKKFFSYLVEFNQARTAEEKNKAFEKVAASRRFRQARRIDHAMYTYLSRWYFPAIREMTARVDFQEDVEWIATQLLPNIKPSEVKEALEILLELGLVVRQDDGKLSRGEPSLTTGHEVHSLAIGNYHRQMLQRASESIESVPSELRDLGALTVCIEPSSVPEIKQRIHTFREQLLDRCDRDDTPRVVYQINLQFFPLNHSDDPSE